ncbi:MAG TPA: MFS transporter [Chthoniobacteraceae bacterium]|jgi:FSR family fosmidomycin resistance protein-like MFS transporter|nr:MFS transporter [Chthoniobacteraceae bacterium]
MSSPPRAAASPVVFSILAAISVSHLLNDTIQSLLPAIFPLLKETFRLNYSQIGWITFTFQCTASILQPFVGSYTDRRPWPFSLAIGMGSSLMGILLLAHAQSYAAVLLAAGVIGLGSSVFHPEASRVARLASGGRHGFAQSLFQVGGNAGSALGPALATLFALATWQSEIRWFTALAVTAILLLTVVGRWYRGILASTRLVPKTVVVHAIPTRGQREVAGAIAILMALIFSKYFYLVSLSNYYTFYLMDRFHVTRQGSQGLLAVFLAAVALGTIVGGPVGDRIGRKRVIWASILGIAPFTLWLPYANLPLTVALSFVIGFILASAFSAILVYAQELIPGRVGFISGLFFGFAFGMAGIAAAVLGHLAEITSITYVFHVCAFLPLIGLLAAFLPNEPKAATSH